MRGSPAPGKHKIGTIARLTGLSPVLLRAWERRYGLLEPERQPSGHRLYTDDDLKVLRRSQELLAAGRAIGEVAALGRPTLLANPAAAAEDGAASRLLHTLIHGAETLDQVAIDRALDDALQLLSFDGLVEEVLSPALRRVGERWCAGQMSVASEHLLSGAIAQRLRGLLGIMRPRSGPRVVVACVPGEAHEIAALIVALEACRQGLSPTFLGGCVPLPDLERTLEVVQPRALLLSVTRAGPLRSQRTELAGLVRRWSRRVTVLLGGAGARETRRTGAMVWEEDRPLAELRATVEARRPRRD